MTGQLAARLRAAAGASGRRLGLAGAKGPGQARVRDPGPRRRSPHGPDPYRARRDRNARLHPAGDQGQRALALVRRGRRPGLRAGAGQHLPPAPLAGRGADRRARRPARLHGLGAGDHHRLRRLPGLLARPRRRRRRDQGAARRAGGRGEGRDLRARGRLPVAARRLRPLHRPRGVDGDPGEARLRHRARLRRVHAVPRRPRLHRALDGAHPPLARPLPRLARARGPGRQAVFGIVQGGVHEDLRRESAEAVSARPEWTGWRSAAPSARRRRRCARCSAFTAPLLPPEAPVHLLGIGEVDDLLAGIALGIDVFDCAVPTRLARHGVALGAGAGRAASGSTWPRRGTRTTRHPITEGCPCEACRRHSRAYLHYLARSKELTGARLLTLHNLTYMERLTERAHEQRSRKARYAAYAEAILGGATPWERRAETPEPPGVRRALVLRVVLDHAAELVDLVVDVVLDDVLEVDPVPRARWSPAPRRRRRRRRAAAGRSAPARCGRGCASAAAGRPGRLLAGGRARLAAGRRGWSGCGACGGSPRSGRRRAARGSRLSARGTRRPGRGAARRPARRRRRSGGRDRSRARPGRRRRRSGGRRRCRRRGAAAARTAGAPPARPARRPRRAGGR